MSTAKKSTALAKAPSEDALAELRNEFPAEQGFQSVQLPRLGFKSQDVTEGKGRAMKVVIEAGTFLDEYPTEETNEEGKAIWAHDDIGNEVEVTIAYKRKQLRMFNEGTGKFASTPVYDTDDEVIPLFEDKAEIARGTARELQAKFMGVGRNGKPKSDLEENVILYVLHDGVLKQMNLRGSSMYNFKGYARKTLVPSVLTRLASEEKENGSVSWNAMTFEAVRPLSAEEVDTVRDTIRELKEGIGMQKAQFAAIESADRDPLASEFDEDDLPFGKKK